MPSTCPSRQLLTDEQRLSPDDRAKLSAILTAHRHVGQLIERGRQLRDELQAIEQEQKRIRENLGALGESASERELRERFVRTLTTQEDRLERLGAEQKRLNHELSAARAELDKLLQAFELELG
jgi:predicted RNase H-like nuclease (RuvC/YqgF family)